MKTILYFGRLHYLKGVDLLIEAFADFSGEPVTLQICGSDDGQLAGLEMLVSKYSLEKQVEILPPVYGDARWQLYRDADLYVLPTRYEIFGLTVLEALSQGTPVITTPQCGLADIIKPPVGEVTTIDRLPCVMRKWLNIGKGDGECRKEFARRFSWEESIDKLEEVYFELAR